MLGRMPWSTKQSWREKPWKVNEAIEELVNSDDPDDIMKVNLLKEEAQEIEDERETTAAKKYFVKMQLEGEKPTKFFCKLNKKHLEKTQFEELHVVGKKPNGKLESLTASCTKMKRKK